MLAIDPTARISPSAVIGADVEVGPYCVIGPNVAIGDSCKLIAHVHLAGRRDARQAHQLHGRLLDVRFRLLAEHAGERRILLIVQHVGRFRRPLLLERLERGLVLRALRRRL